jgi:hypothetical protein
MNDLSEKTTYSIQDILLAMEKLDTETQALLYTKYKMSDYFTLMNNSDSYHKFIHDTKKLQKDCTMMINGVTEMRRILKSNEQFPTDQQLADDIVKMYWRFDKSTQDSICQQLGLAKTDAPVSVESIIADYKQLSDEEKVDLDGKLRECDNLTVSVGRLAKTLDHLICKKACHE